MDLSVTQKQLVHAVPVDKAGNTVNAPLDAPPTWVASNPQLLALAPAADGLSCEFTPTGTIGTLNVTVTGAFKGSPISGVLSVNLTAGVPAGFTFTFDPPVSQ